MSVVQSKFIREVGFHIKAAYPYLYVVTDEPDRMATEITKLAENYLVKGAKSEAAKFKVFRWSTTKGWMINGKPVPKKSGGDDEDMNPTEPVKNFAMIEELVEGRGIFLMESFHFFLTKDNPTLIQMVRDLYGHCNQKNKTVIFMNSIMEIPQELEAFITVLNHDMPTVEDINGAVDQITESVADKIPAVQNMSAEKRYQVIESLKGMRLTDVDNALSYSLVTTKDYDPKVLRAEKCKAIQKSGVLESIQTDENFDNVGGLENLKDWLSRRMVTMGPSMKQFNLKHPKGIAVIGPPGVGKTLIAKATANKFGIPLIKFDFGNVMSKFVGESEHKIRKALQMIDALAPCVLWMDEFEKAVAGSGGSGDLDSGVTMRTTGYFLQWLNDHTSPVFPFATINRIDLIPVEMMRKGRFDELFFVDMPNATERLDVCRIQLRKQKLDPEKFDLKALAEKSAGFNGAEIERAIDEAKIVAACRKEFPTQDDVLKEMSRIIPEGKKNKQRIDAIRSRASEIAVAASIAESVPTEVTVGGKTLRAVDV